MRGSDSPRSYYVKKQNGKIIRRSSRQMKQNYNFINKLHKNEKINFNNLANKECQK